ncbi:MAG TPA: hypothetical protein VFO85_12845, partial [Vicinamibacteria bacterium]|nr:hypothetical protein [Vicinamibacteria bacterium]
SLYVVDFGVLTVGERGPQPREKTGVLWRVTRQATMPSFPKEWLGDADLDDLVDYLMRLRRHRGGGGSRRE